MENQNHPDLNLDEDFTSPEELLASLGEGTINVSTTYQFTSFNNDAHGHSANDWNYGMQGLLDPLRRPDPNQIPPDVLSLLLKSVHLAEVLNPQFEPSSSVQGHIQHDSNSSFQQQDTVWNTYSPNQQLNSSSQIQNLSQQCPTTPPQVLQQNQPPSKLSPLAPEFIPRFHSSHTHEPSIEQRVESQRNTAPQIIDPIQNRYLNQQHNSIAYTQQQHVSPPNFVQDTLPRQYHPTTPRNNTSHRCRQYTPQEGNTPSGADHEVMPYEFETNTDRVLTIITDSISYLTHDPANFNSSMRKVMKVLAESLTDIITLEIMVTLILEQSITNRNFFSTGARMCQTLNENGIAVGQLTAQSCIMQQVQKEFTLLLKATPDAYNKLRERQVGILLFMGELFVRFKVQRNLFFGFGIAICELIIKFNAPENAEILKHEDVKVILNLLKLAGWELDHHPNPKLQSEMGNMLSSLSEVLRRPNLPSNTKALIEKVFELRSSNWGREDRETTPPSDSLSTTPPTCVVYDGKEQEHVYEEPSSSDEEEGGVYLDEEAEKSFDLFLSEMSRGCT